MIQEAVNTLMDILRKHPVVDNIMLETDNTIGVTLYDNTYRLFDGNEALEMIEWIEQQKI